LIGSQFPALPTKNLYELARQAFDNHDVTTIIALQEELYYRERNGLVNEFDTPNTNNS